MKKALLQLGRFGDIINVLPVVHESARAMAHEGRKPVVCASEEFADVLEGVSYCDILRHPAGPIQYLEPAKHWLSARGYQPVVSQIYSDPPAPRRTESYMRDSWEVLGRGHLWEQLGVVFDRRDAAREEELCRKFSWDKPVVFFCFAGKSSPFYDPELLSVLRRRFPEVSFEDIGAVRAHRIYDLLGLLDRAAALITIDTAILHLARASTVPTIAFVNPQPWLGSLPSANHVLYRKYTQVNPVEVEAALRRVLYPKTGQLIHVWSDYPGDERMKRAQASWQAEYARGDWRQAPVRDGEFARDGRAVGDRPLPFIRDLVEFGARRCSSPEDVVVLTNSDVGFTPGLTERLRRHAGAFGAVFAYRFNFENRQPRDWREATSGYWDGGLDFFAFQRQWLDRHFGMFGDFLLGRPDWDLVLRDTVKRTGGGDLSGAVWHEFHPSEWNSKNPPGNQHNRAISRRWFATTDSTRPYASRFL